MFCIKCQHDVVDCTCPDILERLRSISQHPNLDITRTLKSREARERAWEKKH